jgi:hypothetical protein
MYRFWSGSHTTGKGEVWCPALPCPSQQPTYFLRVALGPKHIQSLPLPASTMKMAACTSETLATLPTSIRRDPLAELASRVKGRDSVKSVISCSYSAIKLKIICDVILLVTSTVTGSKEGHVGCSLKLNSECVPSPSRSVGCVPTRIFTVRHFITVIFKKL